VAFALAWLAFACSVARPLAAKEMRRVLFLRQESTAADAELVEALRIQLAGSAELIELRATPLGSEASAAWRTTHAELVVWVDGAPGGNVLALRNSAPAEPVTLGPQPDGADASRVLALKISELLELEPDVVPASQSPQAPRRPPSTIAFLELRAGATHGGSPKFWLPNLGFASGPRFLKPHGFGELYGIFALSADANDPRGLFELSRLYFRGRGAFTNLNEFWRLATKASELGSLEADTILAEAYLRRAPGGTNQAEAFAKCRRAADTGFGQAQLTMALIELRGLNGTTNWNDIVRWLKGAYDHGIGEGAYQLALLYGSGTGVEKDPRVGAQWMEMAAQKGVASAEWGYAMLLNQGFGVPKDASKSFNYVIRSANHGQIDAQYSLGLWYASRPGSSNLVEAAKWLQLAGSAGAKRAQAELDRILPRLEREQLNELDKRVREVQAQLPR
jgi:TPR repeat protein